MNLDDLLQHVVAVDATDLHVKAGSVPHVRVAGQLIEAPFTEPTADSLTALAEQLLDDDTRAHLEANGSVDLVHSAARVGRFRVNVYRQRGSLAVAVRRVVPGIPELDDLDLPPSVARFAEIERGLVIVAGPAGSGTTTTAAALIDAVNSNRAVHIATVEDPIEVLHADKQGIVSQREIGTDAATMSAAVKQCLKQDPDVVFVGELPDADTIRAAITAAETGKLVFAVMRSSSSVETIDRLVQAFPLAEQRQVRVLLSRNLEGILCQRLLERSDGSGRVAAAEVMVGTSKSLVCVADGDKLDDLPQVLAEGRYSGMQTFDQGVVDLYREGTISMETALGVVHDEEEFRITIERGGYGI